jgi:hypothetical protein
MLQQIRVFLAATPFRPFQIHVSSGVIYRVDHPENAAVLGRNVVVTVPEAEDAVAVISPLHIVSVNGTESVTA